MYDALYLKNRAHYSANKLNLLPVIIAATDQQSRSCDSSIDVKYKTADRSIYTGIYGCGNRANGAINATWYGWFLVNESSWRKENGKPTHQSHL